VVRSSTFLRNISNVLPDENLKFPQIKFDLQFSGLTPIRNFVEIRSALVKMKHEDRQALLPQCESIYMLYHVKGKAIRVTGRGGPQGCETSRLPHFLDNRLTDGGEVVSLTHRPPFTQHEYSWHSFLLEAQSTPGS
jgi:hypothetical protein